MDIFKALMDGDIDALDRELEERRFKCMAQFAGRFREMMNKTLVEEVRPGLTEWFLSPHGQHQPSYGTLGRGDLLRWQTATLDGVEYKVPTVRFDLAKLAVGGGIKVRGGKVDLMDFVVSHLNHDTKRLILALIQAKDGK